MTRGIGCQDIQVGFWEVETFARYFEEDCVHGLHFGGVEDFLDVRASADDVAVHCGDLHAGDSIGVGFAVV